MSEINYPFGARYPDPDCGETVVAPTEEWWEEFLELVKDNQKKLSAQDMSFVTARASYYCSCLKRGTAFGLAPWAWQYVIRLRDQMEGNFASQFEKLQQFKRKKQEEIASPEPEPEIAPEPHSNSSDAKLVVTHEGEILVMEGNRQVIVLTKALVEQLLDRVTSPGKPRTARRSITRQKLDQAAALAALEKFSDGTDTSTLARSMKMSSNVALRHALYHDLTKLASEGKLRREPIEGTRNYLYYPIR